jgi:hypothetical protein
MLSAAAGEEGADEGRHRHALSRSGGRGELVRVAIGMLSKPHRGGGIKGGKCMWLAPCV